MQELVNIFCIMNWIALNCITHSHKTTFHSDVLKQACIAKDESMVDTLFHAHTLNLGDFHSLLKNVEVCIENGFFFGIDIILSHLTKGRQRMLPGVSSAMCLCIKHNNLDFFQRIVSSDTFDSYREINIHSVIELCVAENKPAFFFSIVPKAETHEQEELIDHAIGMGIENNRLDFVLGIVQKFEKKLNISFIMHRMERFNREFFLAFVDNLRKTHRMEDVYKWTRECFDFIDDPDKRIPKAMKTFIETRQIHFFLDYILHLTETHTTKDVGKWIRMCLNSIVFDSRKLEENTELLFKNEIIFIFHHKIFFSLFHDEIKCFLNCFIRHDFMTLHEIQSFLTFQFNGFFFWIELNS